MGSRRQRADDEDELSRLARFWAKLAFAGERRTVLTVRCGVSFFALVSLLACNSAPEPPSQSTAAADQIVRIGVSEAEAEAGQDVGVGQLTNIVSRDNLTQTGIDGRALPKMAERWSWENDFRTLRVVLRHDIIRHDGTPFTAAEAVPLLRHATRPGNWQNYASFADIVSIKAENKLELVITLSQPSALLPEDLSVQFVTPVGEPGVGPFKLVSDTKATELELEGFDRYYGGRPLHRVVVRPYKDMRSTWAALLRGELDVVSNVPFDAVEFIENNQLQVATFQPWYQTLIAFNSSIPVFRNPKVRAALNIAIDRKALVEKVLHGRGGPSDGPFWPKYWAYDSTVNPYTYDPAQAIELLEQAGYSMKPASPDGHLPPARLRFICLIPENFSVLERLALEVRKSLSDIGVDMALVAMPLTEQINRVAERKFEAALADMISGPTPSRPYNFWRSERTFSPENRQNNFGYENPEAEALFTTIRRTTNEAAVRGAMARLQRVMRDDPPALFIAWNERARVAHRRYQIPTDTARDPLLSLWRWGSSDPRIASR